MAEEGPAGKLSLTIAPPVVPADGSSHLVVYVQLMGADGVPRLSSQNTEITLVSSDPRVMSVPVRAYILASESYTIVALSTTAVPGNSVITAASPGYTAATAEVTTFSTSEATPPFRLSLVAAPSEMFAGGRPPGRLSVVLLGANGRPLAAPDSLNVVLSTSNPDVVRFAEWITIPQGAHYATTPLEPLAVGSATLSSVSPGFVSEFIEVRVVEPGQRAEALALYPSPAVLRSGTGSHLGLIVQAVDDTGTPVPFPCTQIHLASSAPLSAGTPAVAEVSCDQDAQYATATVTIGDLPGAATITAVARGLHPATAGLEVHGEVAVQLKAYVVPESLLGLGSRPGFIVVQVLDESGIPVRSHNAITVKLLGGDGILPDEAVIPRGRSFVTLELGILEPRKQVDLWVTNPSLNSATLSMKTHALPTSAEATASEGPFFPLDQQEILVLVRSSGSPLPGAKLTWTASNGTLTVEAAETDGTGEGRALFTAGEPGDGVVEVVATKLGYEAATAQVNLAVVASAETGASPPKLVGIPALYLLLVIPVIVLGYLLHKFLPAFRRRPG